MPLPSAKRCPDFGTSSGNERPEAYSLDESVSLPLAVPKLRRCQAPAELAASQLFN
jgi:hypothetical protein